MAVRDGSGKFHIDVIDVGQADSILLEGPDGTTMLVDSGHWHDEDEHVLDHLNESEIDHLDYLVATHDDWDHIGGHADIIDEFGSDGIGTVYSPAKEEEGKRSAAVTQYKTALAENGIKENQLHAESAALDLDGVTIDILNPSEEIDSKARNENSVVMQATYGKQSILLAGDIKGKAETQLVEKHAEQLSDVDVLKTAHHGSKFSTGEALLETCEPETVLYSHAEESKHDHPDTETVTRTTQADNAHSTALHGTTSLTFDGQNEIAVEHTNDTDLHDATDFAALIHYHRDNDVALDEIDSIARSDLLASIPYEIVDNASIIEDSQAVQTLQDENEALQDQLDEATEALDAKDNIIDEKDQRIEQLQNRLAALEQATKEQTASEEQTTSNATERELSPKTAQDSRGSGLGNGSETAGDQTNAAVEEFQSQSNSNGSQASVGSEMANSSPKDENPADTTHNTSESDDEGDDKSSRNSQSRRRRR